MWLARRTFLSGLVALRALKSQPVARIDPGRLRASIEALSTIGRPAGGSFQDGVSRLGYSDADLAGRAYCMRLMKDAGASVRIDAAGNIFARRAGTNDRLPPVLFGSHIDSVRNGGNFDGDLGSLAAIHILEYLRSAGIQTRHPLEAVIWSCEEASFAGKALNGSRAVTGGLRPGELEDVSEGRSKAEAMRRAGGDVTRLESAQLKPQGYHAYVELHIEQGGTLEKAAIPVGVVDGIVSIDDYDIYIEGFANHAGTTMMRDRSDAMVAAAEVTLAVREIATSEPGRQVGTVGHVEVSPNAANVIPGKVHLTVDFRDLSEEKLARMGASLHERCAAIAGKTHTKIEVRHAMHAKPALADAGVQKAIESAARGRNLPFQHMPSGAGHDAQIVAPRIPMGMIFVPSIGGISHSPRELTSWEDCHRGAEVLLSTVLELAR